MPIAQGLPSFRPKLISVAVASCFVAGTAMANPTGPTVVHGQASIEQIGNLLRITNSPNAIINWQSFSIGANEITRFIQQSQASAVLNRVTGGGGAIDPSVILGALQSNGRVFLINPSGITFGAGAQIDVAGLVASTLDISNADFLANRLRFQGTGAGGVLNEGNIAAGEVYLVGSAVTNNGLITSPNGEVVLAAGNSVELVNPGTPNLRVEVTASDHEARNLGQIAAESGRVGIYAGLIRNSGTVSASSAVAEGGRILLKATKEIVLDSTSVLDASGAGGGTIEVLAKDGGRARIDGRLDASAPVSGDGGFVETSASEIHIASGTRVTTAAAQGKSGTWLIDPTDFTISAGGGGQTTSGIGADTLVANLNDPQGGDIIIATDDDGQEAGDINVNAAVSWDSSNSLTLIAHNDINVNQKIENAGDGGISMYAGWDESSGTSFPDVLQGNGNINVGANLTGGFIELVAGNQVNVDAANLTAQGPGPRARIAGLGGVSISGSMIKALDGGEGAAWIDIVGDGVVIASSTLEARGGSGILGSGGFADIYVNANGGTLSISGSTIEARGGNGGAQSSGEAAYVSLYSESLSTINISGGTKISAIAGTGGGGAGRAVIEIYDSSSDINITGSQLLADGAEGIVDVYADDGKVTISGSSLTASADADAFIGALVRVHGNAVIINNGSTLAANSTGPNVDAWVDVYAYGVEGTTVSGSTVTAAAGTDVALDDRGNGYIGIGSGSAGGSVAITGSTVKSSGLEADIQVTSDANLTVSNSTFLSEGRQATVDLEADGGNLAMTNSTATARGALDGGEGGGEGVVDLSAQGAVSVSGSTLRSEGGHRAEVGATAFGGNISAGNSTFTAITVDGGEGVVGFFAPQGSVNAGSSTLQASDGSVAQQSLLDGGVPGAAVFIEANGNVTLGRVTSDDLVVVASGGSIIDGNTGVNIESPNVFLEGTSGVGSIDNPLELSTLAFKPSSQPAPTLHLGVWTGSGEIGVIHAGGADGQLMLLDLQNQGSDASAVATTGTMMFDSDIHVSGALSLGANNGMLVENNITAGGGLELRSGAGDMGFDGVFVNGPTVTLVGKSIFVGFTSSTGPTTVAANDVMDVRATGNLNVLGGANSNASALLAGNEINMEVGGVVNVAGGDAGASAQIHAATPLTIHLHFPNRMSGGYFVNGVESVISDGDTGFFALGQPAIPGENFFVTYGGVSTPPPPVDQAVNQVIHNTNKQTDDEKKKEVVLEETQQDPEKEQEKDLPVCN